MKIRNLLLAFSAFGLISSFATAIYASDSASTTKLAPAATKEKNIVLIKNYKFVPEMLSVTEGTTVIWTNKDYVQHSVNSNTFNSKLLNTDESFEYTFTKKGTYKYDCDVHPSMKGVIVVK